MTAEVLLSVTEFFSRVWRDQDEFGRISIQFMIESSGRDVETHEYRSAPERFVKDTKPYDATSRSILQLKSTQIAELS
ncbi:MAG TPA: hypothetical protein DD473_21610, partial [Planctomycetaceae bacterium]|nr:hypothetical protein [Planctomycetaceae bacterium]